MQENEAWKAYVDAQLEKLKSEEPFRRLGLLERQGTVNLESNLSMLREIERLKHLVDGDPSRDIQGLRQRATSIEEQTRRIPTIETNLQIVRTDLIKLSRSIWFLMLGIGAIFLMVSVGGLVLLRLLLQALGGG